MTEIVPPLAELEEMKNLGDSAPVKVRKKRASKHDFKDGRGRVFAHRHVNGEGWVADTAKVADTVFVAKTAQVYHHAVIVGKVQVRHRGQVCGTAELMDNVTVNQTAFVGGDAIMTDTARASDNAKLWGGTVQGTSIINGSATVRNEATILNSQIGDRCAIYGYATVFNSSLSDDVMIGGRAHIARATLQGFISVRDHATITGSHIYHRRGYVSNVDNNRINITDHVTIAGCEHIDAWIDFVGHAMIVGCDLRFRPVYDTAAGIPVKLTTDTQAAIVKLNTREPSMFMRYNVPPTARAAVVAADAFAARQQSGARMPVNLDTLVPTRRIMSTDGAPV
jgi:carbonic anhydrase/acetyltransferase-like protein (isoleucine patch superfamily)